MQNYLNLVERIITKGEPREDRTGVGTLAVFGASLEFDLRDRFPLLTAKETRWRTAFLEMLFFLSGQTNVRWLNERGSKLWDAWADENGNLGPVYGFNWRRWGARPDNIPQPKPRLRDGVEATFAGVANGSGANGHPLLGTWMGMIQRCYDKSSKGYPSYGARGVHVCNEWLEFTRFAKDAETLPGYANKLAEPGLHEIDKDIMGTGFLYSRETCCWVTRQENIQARAEWRYTLEKDGVHYSFINPIQFAKEHGINHQNLDDLWHKGGDIVRYGFRLVSKDRIRPELDQVSGLIHGLRNNPHGRRHIVTAWNVGDLDQMALPPCHHTHQCFVTNDGHLDLKFFMRSSDVALGLPFNIAAYALLTHLYARAASLKPGRLLVDIGDAHLYSNHVEPMKRVLHDGPVWGDNAKLVINTENTDIDGYDIGDFQIDGYHPRPFVKLEVAV